MAQRFDGHAVALEVASHKYRIFEFEAFGHVMRRFGVTKLTACKWVNRAIAHGYLKRSGTGAIALV